MKTRPMDFSDLHLTGTISYDIRQYPRLLNHVSMIFTTVLKSTIELAASLY